jgi:hypothetical protein
MQISKVALGLLALLSASFMTGCGAQAPEVVMPAAKDVADMKSLRVMFDSVNGDYSKLNDDQKKQFLAFGHGNQSEVDHIWAFMQNPRGGSGAGGESAKKFVNGPNGQILPPGSGQ